MVNSRISRHRGDERGLLLGMIRIALRNREKPDYWIAMMRSTLLLLEVCTLPSTLSTILLCVPKSDAETQVLVTTNEPITLNYSVNLV